MENLVRKANKMYVNFDINYFFCSDLQKRKILISDICDTKINKIHYNEGLYIY